jgi:hypothetical protein
LAAKSKVFIKNHFVENLIFPAVKFRLKRDRGSNSIFDIIRRKYIILTPEEWVRQHFVHYMIAELKYPKSLICVEDGLRVNNMKKRSDIVVYDRSGAVFMVAECKSFKLKLNQQAMNQVSAYNQTLQAQYLALTNGKELYVCKMNYKTKGIVFLQSFPEYAQP